MQNSETATPVQKNELDAPCREALLTLCDMQPVLERLAEQSRSNRVRDAVNHIRRAVSSKLEEGNNLQPEPRTLALMRWARIHNIYGGNTFRIQGTIIRRSVPWMSVMAGEMLQMEMEPTLSQDHLRTAGYYTLKGCVWEFDPARHGDDFDAFARPFVSAALQHCLKVGRIDIDEKPTMEYLQSLVDGTHAAKKTGETNVRLPVQPAATSDESTPPALPPQQSDVATAADDHAPAEHDSEQEIEWKRKRRFCRWAKDDHNVSVTQDQFEQAVQAIAEKHHPLANGVVDRMTLNTFRGGKSAVRREAKRLLPQRVRDYDPAGGDHFNQFITVWLEPKLKEFVNGNGKKSSAC